EFWERVSSVPHAEALPEKGIFSTQAVSLFVQTGRWLRLKHIFRPKKNRSRLWLLPNGSHAVQCGARQTDLLLAWAAAPLDEARVRDRWPRATRIDRLGPALFLVAGVSPEALPTGAHPALRLAEKRVQDARVSAAATP